MLLVPIVPSRTMSTIFVSVAVRNVDVLNNGTNVLIPNAVKSPEIIPVWSAPKAPNLNISSNLRKKKHPASGKNSQKHGAPFVQLASITGSMKENIVIRQ